MVCCRERLSWELLPFLWEGSKQVKPAVSRVAKQDAPETHSPPAGSTAHPCSVGNTAAGLPPMYVASPSLCAVSLLLGRQGGWMPACRWAVQRQLHAGQHR